MQPMSFWQLVGSPAIRSPAPPRAPAAPAVHVAPHRNSMPSASVCCSHGPVRRAGAVPAGSRGEAYRTPGLGDDVSGLTQTDMTGLDTSLLGTGDSTGQYHVLMQAVPHSTAPGVCSVSSVR